MYFLMTQRAPMKTRSKHTLSLCFRSHTELVDRIWWRSDAPLGRQTIWPGHTRLVKRLRMTVDFGALSISSVMMAAVAVFRRNCFEYSEDEDLLGSGSFGSVYRCRLTTSLETSTVALKVLSLPQRLKERYGQI